MDFSEINYVTSDNEAFPTRTLASTSNNNANITAARFPDVGASN
jgi:hypothetical protein